MMFEIDSNCKNSHFFIRSSVTVNGKFGYLHCDGRIINVCEYFESREAAQEVLDKFYPKPEHEWEHGDVFKSGLSHHLLMIYLKVGNTPKVFCLGCSIAGPSGQILLDLDGAKFLFNIKEKINEKNNQRNNK